MTRHSAAATGACREEIPPVRRRKPLRTCDPIPKIGSGGPSIAEDGNAVKVGSETTFQEKAGQSRTSRAKTSLTLLSPYLVPADGGQRRSSAQLPDDDHGGDQFGQPLARRECRDLHRDDHRELDHGVTAVYTGDADDGASTSSVLLQTVN